MEVTSSCAVVSPSQPNLFKRQKHMKRTIQNRGGNMKFIIVVTTLLISSLLFAGEVDKRESGNLVLENIPDIPESLTERLFQYQNTRSAYLNDFDPKSNAVLINTRFGETSQFHLIQNELGMRQQVTFFNEPVYSGRFCPDTSNYGFLFRKDIGGSEFNQIFWFDMQNGSYKMLTDGESRNGDFIWSNKGDKFCYYSTKRNGKDWDIYLATADKMEKASPVLEKEGTWYPVDWSPADTKLLVGKYVSANESYYYILDLNTKELAQMNPSGDKISYGNAYFSKDDKGIYYTSDENSEYQQLHFYDINTKISKIIIDEKWDVNNFDISDDGKYIAYTLNEGGIGKLKLYNTSSKKVEIIAGLPVGEAYGTFAPDNQRLAIDFNSSQNPFDVYIYYLEEKKLERWTKSEVGGLNSDSFVQPDLVHYPTFDKDENNTRMIPAFIYKPKKNEGKLPVIISIHGGPEGQFRPSFRSTYQFWVNELEVAVIAPNVRGSNGYGKSYLKLDNGFKREESVQDIGSLLEWIKKQPDLDENRIAVIGGSYGGYMVLSSMFNYNDKIKCGVDIVGISNFVTFLENTKEYRRDLRRAEYGDERDPEMRDFLNQISPTTNAHKIKKPLFVAQGLNDPRVPASESKQIVEAVRKNGTEVWYMLAKDEGHGFRKKSNRDFYTAATILFFQEHLLK
jgi:dipeptidyl aminopeptidase/acylaminoacyl peptidase